MRNIILIAVIVLAFAAPALAWNPMCPKLESAYSVIRNHNLLPQMDSSAQVAEAGLNALTNVYHLDRETSIDILTQAYSDYKKGGTAKDDIDNFSIRCRK